MSTIEAGVAKIPGAIPPNQLLKITAQKNMDTGNGLAEARWNSVRKAREITSASTTDRAATSQRTSGPGRTARRGPPASNPRFPVGDQTDTSRNMPQPSGEAMENT